MARLARLIHKSDFEALMATPPWSRSAHFAAHHVASRPGEKNLPAAASQESEISTASSGGSARSVDKAAEACWAGAVIPKRHAKRAVTRNLLKRQIRSAFVRHGARLPRGLWLVRLRSSFPARAFVSARSAALAEAARQELDALLGGAARASREPARPRP